MTHSDLITRYRVVNFWSGHSTQGGSTGKEWAAVLAQGETAEGEAASGEGGDDQPTWIFMAVFGKTGMDYQGGRENPQATTKAVAERSFLKMVREKASAAKGYRRTSGNVDVGEGATGPQGFAGFLPYFKIPLVMPEEEGGADGGARVAAAAASPLAVKRATLGYTACDVRPIDMALLQRLMADPRYGVGEKVDGRRRFVRFDGQRQTGYNRQGEELPAIPPAWRVLERLGPILLDGEHLPVGGGLYAIFEPIELGGSDVRSRAYQENHRALEEAMIAAGLIRGAGATLRQAVDNALVEGIALLSVSRSVEQARAVLEQVQAIQAEGVVLRLLGGRYDDPRAVQKWKYYPTVDAVAVGIQREGKVVGSVRMAMVRPRDGALIEVCTVRSGLTSEEVEELARAIDAAGQSQGAPAGMQTRYPVLELSFLLPSTPGRRLVQPSVVKRRDDKLPGECTFDQFLDLFVQGRDRRAALIEEADPIEGITLSSL